MGLSFNLVTVTFSNRDGKVCVSDLCQEKTVGRQKKINEKKNTHTSPPKNTHIILLKLALHQSVKLWTFFSGSKSWGIPARPPVTWDPRSPPKNYSHGNEKLRRMGPAYGPENLSPEKIPQSLYIFSYLNGWFLCLNVGKYTRTMDPLGNVI